MDAYFKNRASVRDFSSENIPQELLYNIIEAAMKAPTCGNMQLYSVIVTRNPENKQKLAAFHFNQPAATSAPVILTICADFYRFSKWCQINEATPGYDNFHSFITALTDAVIFTQQLATIAEKEGLGTCYLGTVNYNATEISEFLKLPELVVPVASLAIGYKKTAGEETERLPLKAILHDEAYRNDTDKDIQQLFSVKEEYEANKKFVKENNKQSLAQIFTDIRYPKEMNEKVSDCFMSLLKSKNFIN